MKKFLIAVITAISVMAFLPFNIFAADKEIKILVDGESIDIPAEYGKPYNDEHRRMQIPMRYILEACGCSVVWDESSQTAKVHSENGDVEIKLGSNELKTSNGTVLMDTTASINADGRIYIPIRHVLEALNFEILWKSNVDCDTISIITGNKNVKHAMTPNEISKKASGAVFYMEVFQGETLTGTGSGFFIDPNGIAVTNYHVIENTTSAVVTLTDGSQHKVENILYYNKEEDVAVLEILPKTNDLGEKVAFPFLETSNSEYVENGDKIYAIGSPQGLQNSITDGIVSNKQRIGDSGNLYIQISAPISSGSSGGALLNEYAQVIGITSATIQNGQNLNLAVPINRVTDGLENASRIPYEAVFEKEFKRSLEYNAKLGEKLWEESESDMGYSLNYIDSGDTFIGTFEEYDDMDFYRFYVPVPVYATITGGALFEASNDAAADAKVKESFIFTINKSVDQPYMLGSMFSDEKGNVFMIANKKYLEQGEYYIAVFQSIDNSLAWKDKNYFIYMVLETAE
ncbi:MAG: trypsin-like serine protease [Firmicutes bacterium]|nr:trypsin-like serine protease [Bacillota bacterium]